MPRDASTHRLNAEGVLAHMADLASRCGVCGAGLDEPCDAGLHC